MEKVLSGFVRFQGHAYESRRELFAELAGGQSPEVLFITCADSRIDPGLLTQSEPGDLFTCRNAGNIVPPHVAVAGGVTASIEYAVAVLGVRDVIVCGHTDCGAMKAACNPEGLEALPHVSRWLDNTRAAVEVARAKHGRDHEDELKHVTQENVLLQMQHLCTHPCVAAKMGIGELHLHGWVYDIESGSVACYDDQTGKFLALEERYAGILEAPAAAESA